MWRSLICYWVLIDKSRHNGTFCRDGEDKTGDWRPHDGRMRRTSIILLIVSMQSVLGAYFYVSPSGTGNGTSNSPGSLTTAMAHTGWAAAITAGATVYLRGGIYADGTNFLNMRFSGSEGDSVTWRAYPGERPKVDQPLKFGSYSYHRFWGIEFYNSHKGDAGDGPSMADDSGSRGMEWINCIVHDVNCGWTGSAGGAAIRGCIIWYVGKNDRQHVMYPCVLDFSGNISAWVAGSAIELGTPGITIRSNIMFGAGATVGATSKELLLCYDGALLGNCIYETVAAQTGVYCNANVNSFTVEGNTIVADYPVVFAGVCSNVNFRFNTIYSKMPSQTLRKTAAAVGTWSVDSNTYRSTGAIKFEDVGGTYRTFAQWKATNAGYDVNSTATDSTTPTDSVHVYPNADETKRAHIAIYNWTQADNVSVNVASVLSSGDTYRLYSAQNYGTPIQTGVFSGTTISVPMTNLTVAPILYGTSLTQPSPTSPKFGAFVLIGADGLAPASDLKVIPP
jgi:hypothetical protein